MTQIADVPAAASAAAGVLAGYADLDWQQVPAADLEWSCWQTTLHMADCLYFYTMQVIYGQLDGYLCTELALDDSAGFAAMGVVEVLIHTFDVVRGLNPADPWRPPGALAAPVIARLFPHAPSGDPAEVLLYCCGRAALGDMPRQTQWQWDGTVRT
jgi:hypothetical protein